MELYIILVEKENIYKDGSQYTTNYIHGIFDSYDKAIANIIDFKTTDGIKIKFKYDEELHAYVSRLIEENKSALFNVRIVKRHLNTCN